jgi:hypothetical protein
MAGRPVPTMTTRASTWAAHERHLAGQASFGDPTVNLHIDKTRLDIDRVRQELKWEPYKAFAAIIAGVAAMSGIILAVAHLIH